MHFRAGLIGLFLTLICSLFVSESRVSADTSSKLDEVRQAYLKAAFPEDGLRLRKFASVTPLTLVLFCSSQRSDCASSSKLLEEVLSENPSFKLKQQADEGLLRAYFTDEEQLAALNLRLKAQFPFEVMSDSSLFCQAHIALEDSEIKISAIAVSLGETPLRKKTCLLLSFAKALGLGHSPQLTLDGVLGNSAETNQTFTDDQFLKLKRQLDIFIYVHSCPLLKPNMTRAEASLILEKNPLCMRDLGIE